MQCQIFAIAQCINETDYYLNVFSLMFVKTSLGLVFYLLL